MPNNDDALKKKLADIRTRLLADPTTEDLQKMHLHMDALNKWANVNQMRAAKHDHDMAEHHDHEP